MARTSETVLPAVSFRFLFGKWVGWPAVSGVCSHLVLSGARFEQPECSVFWRRTCAAPVGVAAKAMKPEKQNRLDRLCRRSEKANVAHPCQAKATVPAHGSAQTYVSSLWAQGLTEQEAAHAHMVGGTLTKTHVPGPLFVELHRSGNS